METVRGRRGSTSRINAILMFLLHQLIGTIGVMALAGLLTSVIMGLSGSLGWPIPRYYLPRILTGMPYFPVQITLALILGWLLSRRFRHQEMLWVWVIPAAVLCYLIVALPTTAAALASNSRLSHFFGRGCRFENHCADQLGATLPFYVSVAYSLGALIARQMPRSSFDKEPETARPRTHMRKWLATVFGIYGYAVVVCYYVPNFSPPEGAQRVLWSTCVTCMDITKLGGPPWRWIFLFLGPVNALTHAAAGALLGALILKMRRRAQRT